jgi:hypothetical protein
MGDGPSKGISKDQTSLTICRLLTNTRRASKHRRANDAPRSLVTLSWQEPSAPTGSPESPAHPGGVHQTLLAFNAVTHECAACPCILLIQELAFEYAATNGGMQCL